jgi:capsular polysaccharide transport system permease protein
MTPNDTINAPAISRRRRTLLARSALVVILGPTILYALYLILLAPAQYSSTTAFAVRGAQGSAGDMLGAIGLVAPSSTSTDARIVGDYIRSSAMVDALRADHGFDEAYSRFTLDPFSRVSRNATRESATRFWRGRVNVAFDLATNANTVTVSAYTPEDALRLTQGVLLLGEGLVNTMTDRAMTDMAAAASREIERKRVEYETAQQRLSRYQGSRQAIAVNAPAQQAVALVGQLDTRLAEKRTELAVQSQTFQPTAPQIQALQREINALETERQQAINRALAAPGEAAAGGEVEAQAMLFDYQFAQQAYQAAIAAGEAARRQEMTNRKYVVAYVPPQLPQKSNWWSRLSGILAVLLGSAIVWGIGALSYSIIRDHME